ncbi:MAG: prepilin-type N-terminal cleavage/methylation domain-containing protein [Pyrinomonadaceae bacterium]
MPRTYERGFTLIELLLVLVIAGLVATVAVPSFLKARDAADSAVAVGRLRAMHTDQSMYRIQNSRYARLSELNAFANNAHGKTVGSTLRHRDFIFLMFPNPTDQSLRRNYNIIAYRVREARVISQYDMGEDGQIATVLP